MELLFLGLSFRQVHYLKIQKETIRIQKINRLDSLETPAHEKINRLKNKAQICFLDHYNLSAIRKPLETDYYSKTISINE